MIREIYDLIWILHVSAAVGLIIALIYAIRVYHETDKKWYWLSLVLAAFFFLLSEWITILYPINLVSFEWLALIQETSEIFAGLFFIASCYGIYKTMKYIRKRVE